MSDETNPTEPLAGTTSVSAGLDADEAEEARDTISDLHNDLSLVRTPLHRRKKLVARPEGQIQSQQTGQNKPITPPRRAHSDATTGDDSQTPPKRPMSETEHKGKVPDSHVIQYIRDNFGGVIHRGYPLLDFVRNVWSFDPKDIPKNLYYMRKNDVNGYLKCEWRSLPGGEPASCKQLQTILQHLDRMLGDKPQFKTDFNGTFLNLRESFVKGDYAKQKPDSTLTEELRVKEQTWTNMGHVGEVKTEASSKREDLVDADVMINLSKLKVKPYEYAEPAPSSSAPNLKRKVSSNVVAADDTEPKRVRSSHGNGSSKNPPIKVVPEAKTVDNTITNHEVQIVKYINELQCHGVRNYSTGMLFEGRKVTLWYIDCMGIAKSEPFDFIDEPHYLLLAVAALKAANLTELGISPFIEFPARTAQEPFGSYQDALLQLPRAYDAQDNLIEDQDVLQFRFDMSHERDLFNAYGAVGRGTTVFPVRTIPAEDEKRERTRLQTAQKKYESGEALVAKMSWPAERRKSEDGYIRAIRTKLGEHKDGKDYVRNIVELKYSLTLGRGAKELKFPRGLMETFKEQSEARVFRVLILQRYQPLEMVQSPEEFKKIFKEVVAAHHWVFTVAEILHRDLSITNLMFLRLKNEVIGILCDWDLAIGASEEAQNQEIKDLTTPSHEEPSSDSRSAPSQTENAGVVSSNNDVNDDTHEETSTTPQGSPAVGTQLPESQKNRFRTGTGPFMALDLLRYSNPPVHEYRHDLESFFYVLAWFCAVFDPEKNALGYIKTWQAGSHTNILHAKEAFVTQPGHFEPTFEITHALYRPIVDTWVRDLVAQFAQIELCGTEIRTIHQQGARARGSKQIAQLTDQLNNVRARRKDLATFEKFMEALEDDSGEVEHTEWPFAHIR
ncbi:hypothetical protein C8Q75DRAFT_732718 [Abortiporus biennis]|nr:hypothetical protein C8Q75DRAFT_732718 [Abortiporus biennis]